MPYVHTCGRIKIKQQSTCLFFRSSVLCSPCRETLIMPPPPLPSAALMVPALRGACASTRAALSSSSFNVRVDTGEHLFKIRGYSLLDQVIPNRGSIQSTKLRAGDFNWRFHFFPMDPNFFTVDLKLLDHGVMATAAYRVSILDRAGEPEYTCAVGPRRYNWKFSRGEGFGFGFGHVVDVDVLKKAAGRLVDDDDCLNILCHVNVLKYYSEPDESR